ncbi:MAG TPA: phage major capsid protein [Planctomycetaceae bacterium]|nr:phage major capsid protein [Planctomycetaceae bacterium]|tara:strand:- start:1024 stop:2433 length:1410 start_codon:yes stop_codon:yes gene_type:complete
MSMQSVSFLQDELNAKISEAESLNALAERENRDFTLVEKKRWDAWFGPNGSIEKKKNEIAAAKETESRRESLSLQRAATSPGPFGTLSNPNIFPGTGKIMAHSNGNTPQPEVRLISQPLKAFKGPEAQQNAFDCGLWLKSFLARGAGGYDEESERRISGRGWDIRGTATEGTPSAGGYLVPTPLSNAIIDVRQLAGISRALSHVVPMTSDTLDVAKKTAGTTVYYPGEAGTITDSDQTWGSVTLNAKKRAILSYISQELNDDSIIPVMDDLASQMGLDLAIQEDNEYINGDGTSTYGNVEGLKSAIGSAGINDATAGSDTWPELALVDFTDTMGLLQSKYWPRGVSWLCSAQFYYSTMLNLMCDAGGNAISDIEMGQRVGRPLFLGSPVYFSSQMPIATAAGTICAYFGSFADGVMIGDRLGVRIAQSDQFAFDTDRLAIRATSRYDIVCHDVGDASTAGAIVALKTAA